MRVGVLTGGLEGMPPKASRLAGDQPEWNANQKAGRHATQGLHVV